ncbi:hypothetical protein [Parageobacillus thermoglucosidasius]|uniref:hypothetical protein n=1 Tax=Parageobacillus thermoglucosidasius TaxID=1426 RepID=UPI0012668191|nr:hypothetical protein [Parageobacillus thermoglucosidasius]
MLIQQASFKERAAPDGCSSRIAAFTNVCKSSTHQIAAIFYRPARFGKPVSAGSAVTFSNLTVPSFLNSFNITFWAIAHVVKAAGQIHALFSGLYGSA